jgi:hypothetical protein
MTPIAKQHGPVHWQNFVIEYAIADANGHVQKVLREWELLIAIEIEIERLRLRDWDWEIEIDWIAIELNAYPCINIRNWGYAFCLLSWIPAGSFSAGQTIQRRTSLDWALYREKTKPNPYPYNKHASFMQFIETHKTEINKWNSKHGPVPVWPNRDARAIKILFKRV